jgi:hypothetical protein
MSELSSMSLTQKTAFVQGAIAGNKLAVRTAQHATEVVLMHDKPWLVAAWLRAGLAPAQRAAAVLWLLTAAMLLTAGCWRLPLCALVVGCYWLAAALAGCAGPGLRSC